MKKTGGFTLMELMIAIAIIGILVKALIPSVGAYFSRARNTQRVGDVRVLNIGLKTYYTDNLSAPPNSAPGGVDSAQCISSGTGTCWTGYSFNADVVAYKGRTGSLLGSSAFDTLLRPYVPNIPSDPQATRSIGDRYIYSNSSGDIHCNGSETISKGGWIIWQPEIVAPNDDKSCLNSGNYACCSGIGCGSHNFCIIQVDT